jgi:hypothetical protein
VPKSDNAERQQVMQRLHAILTKTKVAAPPNASSGPLEGSRSAVPAIQPPPQPPVISTVEAPAQDASAPPMNDYQSPSQLGSNAVAHSSAGSASDACAAVPNVPASCQAAVPSAVLPTPLPTSGSPATVRRPGEHTFPGQGAATLGDNVGIRRRLVASDPHDRAASAGAGHAGLHGPVEEGAAAAQGQVEPGALAVGVGRTSIVFQAVRAWLQQWRMGEEGSLEKWRSLSHVLLASEWALVIVAAVHFVYPLF